MIIWNRAPDAHKHKRPTNGKRTLRTHAITGESLSEFEPGGKFIIAGTGSASGK